MKKAPIILLLMITLAFSTFVTGYYFGRQYDPTTIHIHGLSTLPSATNSLSPTNATTGANPGTMATQGSNETGSSATNPTTTAPTYPSIPKETEPLWPLDINTATLEQLDTLPGIGPVLAQAIIDYRTKYGPFLYVEDLLRVPGLGEKRLAAILEFIYIAGGNYEDTSCG